MEKQRKNIHFATVEWPPYISTLALGQGFSAQVVREAFLHEGYSVHFTFLPWARAVKMGTEHNYAGYLPEYEGADCMLSAPFPGGPLTLITLKNTPIKIADPNDLTLALHGMKIGVVEGYVNTPAIDDNPMLLIEPSVDDLTNIKKLLAGRIDVMVGDPYTIYYLYRELYPTKRPPFKVLFPVLKEHTLHICFNPNRADSNDLNAAFSKGLNFLYSSGRLLELYRHFQQQLPADLRMRLHRAQR